MGARGGVPKRPLPPWEFLTACSLISISL